MTLNTYLVTERLTFACRRSMMCAPITLFQDKRLAMADMPAACSTLHDTSVLPDSRLVTVLEPGRAERNYWGDIWTYRDLFLILSWRDISVRYKQTVVGIAWALIRPFLTVAVFTVVFGRIAKMPNGGDAPYALMVFAGMLPWFLFSTILTEGANSLVSNANLISKVYFPRLLVPAATAGVAMVDFAINLAMLGGLMIWFGFTPSWHIVLLPVVSILALVVSLGPVLFIAALNVRYRDFRYVIPFIVQFGLYVSPVGFSSAAVPDKWRLWYCLNPVVGVIDAFRWCILGDQEKLFLPGLFASVVISGLLLWMGLRQFRATERTFADLI